MTYEQFFYWLDGYVTSLSDDNEEINLIKDKILLVKRVNGKNILNEYYSRNKELGTINITLKEDDDDEKTTYNP